MTVPCQNFPPTTINAIVLIICTVIISMSIALSRIMCLINFQEPLTYHFVLLYSTHLSPVPKFTGMGLIFIILNLL